MIGVIFIQCYDLNAILRDMKVFNLSVLTTPHLRCTPPLQEGSFSDCCLNSPPAFAGMTTYLFCRGLAITGYVKNKIVIIL